MFLLEFTYPVLVPHRQKALDQDSVCPPSPASVAPLPEWYSFHLHCRQVPLATTQRRGLWIHQPTHTDPHLNGHAVQSKLPRCRVLTKNVSQSLIKKRKYCLSETFNCCTGCPKSSFLYFISLYFSTIGLGKQIILTKVVSFNIIHYFHTCCVIFWLEYSICVLPRQRCAYASIFSSHIFFVFHSPNCSTSFPVFCEYHER